MGSIKEKIFVLVLVTVFSFCLVTRVLADCGLYSDQVNCGNDFACEWCQMPSSNSAKCFKKLEANWPVSPAGTRLYRCSSLTDLVKYFYEWGLAIAGILAFISLIFGGLLYLSSAGNPQGVKEAKDRMFSAIFGLILLFGCWLILNTINPDLTTFRSEQVNLSLIPTYECDTDQDCVKTFGINYECSDAAKGDGNPQGMCKQKTPEETKYYPHALVFYDLNFKGSSPAVLWEENGKNQKDMYAKSVITYFKNHELHFCDVEGCAVWSKTECPIHSSCIWDNGANTCIANCSENCDGSGGATFKNCSLCDNSGCNARFNSDLSCSWDTESNFCYSICEGKNACGYTLQLFANSGCNDQIGMINAYDNNIVRWVDREIKCVRLIKPNY